MISTLVVDASVALKWFFDEDETEQAVDLARSGAELVAPDLLRTEVANGVWKKHRRGLVTLADASAISARVPDLFGALVPAETLMRDALAASFALDHPVYDCLYLTLARRMSIPLVTADTKLCAKAAGVAFKAEVLHIRDWTS